MTKMKKKMRTLAQEENPHSFSLQPSSAEVDSTHYLTHIDSNRAHPPSIIVDHLDSDSLSHHSYL